MSFTRVKFRDVYPGIDVVYTKQQNHLQFHFLVHPGANPRKIKLAYQGADGVRLREATDEGLTGNPGGGSLIFIESIRDPVNGVNVSREESDTVVHEVGHAVANSDTHPVTGGDSNPVGTFSKYTPEYLAKIRSITRPWS
jgi:hypothetical protein